MYALFEMPYKFLGTLFIYFMFPDILFGPTWLSLVLFQTMFFDVIWQLQYRVIYILCYNSYHVQVFIQLRCSVNAG